MNKNPLIASLLMVLTFSGCASSPGWIAGSGASLQQVQDTQQPGGARDSELINGIKVIPVDNTVAQTLSENQAVEHFSSTFASNATNTAVIGPGDVIAVTLWEAPPAILFAATSSTSSSSSSSQASSGSGSQGGTSTGVTLPAQMVASDGTIAIPFIGRVQVADQTPEQVEATIVQDLKGKANQPQVLVDVVKNNASNVTIVGDVNSSTLMPLTPKGERLLDALAFAGGVKQSVSRMSIQLSRGNVSASMPLDSIISDPSQNVRLKSGDVITALFQPHSFSVLGATGKNDEIQFEAQGISLAQALARSGGLDDNRADARGVFVFRFENPKLIGGSGQSGGVSKNKVPVVYEVNLRDPGAFFVTQNFPIENHDVIYVTNAPSEELRKFLSLIFLVASPAATIANDTRSY